MDELSGLVAALFFVAQGADVHPAMGRVYALLAWIPPVTGALVLGALTSLLVTNDPLVAETADRILRIRDGRIEELAAIPS